MFNIWVFLYFTVFGLTTVFFLTESRFSPKNTVLIEAGTIIFFVLFESVLYRYVDQERFILLYFLTVHPICLLLSWFVSEKRDTRVFFILFFVIMYSSFALQTMSMVYLLTDGSQLAAWVSLLCSTAVIEIFTIFYFKKLFFSVVEDLKTVLGILTALLAAYFFINGYLVPDFIGDDRLTSILKIFMTMAAMVVFVLTCVMFSVLRSKNEVERDAELLSTQVSAFNIKITAIKDSEEKIRIERHDMRHRLKTLETLLLDDKKEEAIEYITNTEHHLEEIKPQRYCDNTILDAVIAYYCILAQKSGIEAETYLALPDELPADSAELSIVFANALENAINAASQCQPGERKIWIKGIIRPSFMIEISNTYKNEPMLDKDALPVPDKKGHGLGTRSIAAFCKKWGASYHYKIKNGILKLYIYF